ncbi:MAG: cob(I)yrinic acid a,c-diamide adenosyltransferase [Nitrospirota bacterium]
MTNGLIHIYTGDGKGKTTAAVGLAIRAKSRGLRTLFVYFFKESKPSGETNILKDIGIQILIFDKVKSPLFNPDIDKLSLKEAVQEAISFLKDIFSEENFDMIILDEFICLTTEGLLSEDEAVQFITSKPAGLELVLTGRGATEKMINVADYVTFMQKLKHPFKNNIKGRKGIEF